MQLLKFDFDKQTPLLGIGALLGQGGVGVVGPGNSETGTWKSSGSKASASISEIALILVR